MAIQRTLSDLKTIAEFKLQCTLNGKHPGQSNGGSSDFAESSSSSSSSDSKSKGIKSASGESSSSSSNGSIKSSE